MRWQWSWADRLRPRLGVILAVTCALITTGYGAANHWDWLRFSFPQGWAVGALVLAALPEPGRSQRWEKLARWLLWSSLPALVLQQVAYLQAHQRADVLTIVAWLSLLIGREMAAVAPTRLSAVLRRLSDRDVLAPHAVAALDAELAGQGRRWSVIGALTVATLLMVTWPRAAEFAAHWPSWSIGPAVADQILVVVAGATVGAVLGRMAGYGRLGGIMARRAIGLRLAPDHPDRAAGFKPVGDFYLYQSLVGSGPAVFLAVWVLMVWLGSANPELGHYRPYLDQYLWLLGLAVIFEVLVFVIPLISVHTLMRRYKEERLLTEADLLSLEAEVLRVRLAAGDPDWEATGRRLDALVERQENLEKAPTWPIDASIRRRFTLRSLGLLTPLIGKLAAATPLWRHLTELLSGPGG